VLILKDYPLNIGVCKALGSFIDNNCQSIEKLNLSSNNLKPALLKIIVDRLTSLTYFKSLIIHDNDIDLSVIPGLSALLKKKMPENLEHLRISNCKINWETSTALVTTINEKCFLKKLELVDIKMNDACVELLLEIIEK
jgi:hypothetical protein